MNTFLLLVPIHLDALHLKNSTSVAEAMIEFNRLPYFSGTRDVNPDIVNLGESIVSQPFQNHSLYLKPGIHLHWALPDALTTQSVDGEFPNVPNRWLVMRKSKEGESKSWIVESDYLHPATNKFQENSITYPYRNNNPRLPPFRYLGRKLSLEDWIRIQSGNSSDQYLERLTAVGYGEPTFAAFYPNCRSVFGFHDPEFADPDTLTGLTYDVIGWYSHEQDYLSEFFRNFEKGFKQDLKDKAKSPTPEEFISLVERELKWGIVTSPPSNANNQPPKTVEQICKEKIPNIKKELTWQETLDSNSFIPQIVCFSRLTFSPQNNIDQSLQPKNVNIKLTVANTGTEALSAYLAYLAKTIHPSQKAIAEEQLEALQLAENLAQQQLDIGFKFEELRHEAGFNAVAGGALWKIQLDTAKNQPNAQTTSSKTTLDLPDELATMLNALNQTQQNYDVAWAKIISRRRQLFSDWYKYMVSTYPPEGSLDKYPNIDDVKLYIEQKGMQPLNDALKEIGTLHFAQNDSGDLNSVTGSENSQAANLATQINNLITEIANYNVKVRQQYNSLSEETTANSHPPAIYSLKRASSPRYWEPKEPVVLIVGDEAVQASLRHGEDGQSDPGGLLNCHLLKIDDETIGRIQDKQFVQAISKKIMNKLDELQKINEAQIGFATWEKQPWNPMLLEWLIELFPVTTGGNKNYDTNYNYRDNFITTNYSLGINDIDLSPKSPSFRTETNGIKIDTEPNIYSGSSILTPYANSLLQKRIKEYLSRHNDTGETRIENPIYQKISTYEELLTNGKERDEDIERYLRQNVSKKFPGYENAIRIDDNPLLGNLGKIKEIKKWYEDQGLTHIPHPIATATNAQTALENLNCLSQALGNFNQALLMHKQTLQLAIEDPIGFEDYQAFTERVHRAVDTEIKSAPQPLDDFNPIRAGEMRIIDLQLIDTFGQVRNLDWKDEFGKESVITPESMKGSGFDKIALPPRFVQPCRINFRWLSAEDNLEMNAHPVTSPICGWILPNNLNNSLMIYDSSGQALGSINLNGEWDDPPGNNPLTKTPKDFSENGVTVRVEIPNITNIHLHKVVEMLMKREGFAKQAALPISFLKNFNLCLNNALNNIDPENFAQHQSLALLMGRPIAIVRAAINLELQGLPAINQDWNVFRREMDCNASLEDRDTDNFVGVKLPIRIGDYRQLNDGVIGYWKEIEDGTTYKYEDDIFYSPQSDINESDKIETLYVNPAINPGVAEGAINIIQSIDSAAQILTMLVDPRGVFHATSGVLPSKAITIPPEQYAKALANIKANFLITPILTEQTQPKRLRLPLPTSPEYDWVWLEKQGRNQWAELMTFPVIEKSVFTQAYSQNLLEGNEAWADLVKQQWLIQMGDHDDRKAKIVPKDNRPKLVAPLENLDEAIEKLFDLYAVSIQPVSSKAVFGVFQEIREGWLVLSDPQKPFPQNAE